MPADQTVSINPSWGNQPTTLALREIRGVVIIEGVPNAFRWASVVRPAQIGLKRRVLAGREQRHWKVAR